jgi:hypothetical protein
VLFIGNSYTYVNDLPGMLARIAATAPFSPRMTTDALAVGGWTLEDHWNDGTAQARIVDGGWTHVVIQGQSLEPAVGTMGPTYGFSAFAQRFGDVVIDAGAQPLWYVTWARAPGDAVYDPPFGYFLNPEEMQDRLTTAYAAVSSRWPQSRLACVGEAFRASLRDRPQLQLHQADRSHPTVAGTYLAACTFYVAMTGQAVPEEAEAPAELSPDDARFLRATGLVGANCADVRMKALVELSEDFFTTDGPDGGPPFDYGTAGNPQTTLFTAWNHSDSAAPIDSGAPAGLADGMALAPPFSWTTGAYPGGSGKVTLFGVALPFCGATLAMGARCALSVTFSGASSGTGRVALSVTDAYRPTASRALSGTATDRALLTMRVQDDLCTSEPCARPIYVGVDSAQTLRFDVLITNRGAQRATSLAEGAPLAPPFFWGDADGGTFPGGTGTGTFGGMTFNYCSSHLDPSEGCLVTMSFAPTDAGIEYPAELTVGYSDALGPLPAASRELRGYWSGTP